MPRLFAPILIVAAFAPIAVSGDKSPAAVLRVASRDIPSRFSPSGPLTDADRQAHDLIFEPLIAADADTDGSPRYRACLAEAIPAGQGTHLTFRLRPGAVWSNGEPVTVNDVRHSLSRLRKDSGAAFAWEALLDQTQLGASPNEVRLSLRHGLLQPWDCFTFPIVKDDADSAKPPIGSGPFTVAGPTKYAGATGIVFRKNPHHPLAAKIPFAEIHWFAAADAKALDKLRPDLTLGFDASEAGARTVKTALTRGVWYVAPNHRHPLLARPELRRFLGLSIERDKIAGANPGLSVAGLTPRNSWTQAPAPRVPDDLHQPEIARGLASKIAESNASIALTFKFPADQTAKMTQLIDQWQTAAKLGRLDLKIQPMPLSSAELAQALAKHDYELALTREDHGDSIGRLTAMFDQRPQSVAAGGSNFLGVQDVALLSQIAALPGSRQFPLLRTRMHNLHVDLVQSMTIIPLWRHQAHYSLTPSERNVAFDPLRPFADMSSWR